MATIQTYRWRNDPLSKHGADFVRVRFRGAWRADYV